jgi:hypothetical protein
MSTYSAQRVQVKAAALKGKAFCFYHTNSRRFPNPTLAEAGILLLPSVGTFFQGLQIAASVVPKAPRDQRPGDTVRETFEDPDSRGTIGPEAEGCDPEDCAKCQKRFHCKDNPSPQDQVETKFRREHLAYKPDK